MKRPKISTAALTEISKRVFNGLALEKSRKNLRIFSIASRTFHFIPSHYSEFNTVNDGKIQYGKNKLKATTMRCPVSFSVTHNKYI
jgi:hypothetical protein